MLLLDTTQKSLQLILAGAVTTNQLPFVVGYVDIDQTTMEMTALAETDGTSNDGTAVAMLPAPAAGKSRQLKFLSVHQADTVAAVVTIRLNNNGTFRTAWKGTLAVGDNWLYTDDVLVITDANGNIKTQLGGVLLAANFPALSGDVTTTAGSLVTAIGALKVTNAMLAGSIAAAKLIGTDIATLGKNTSYNGITAVSNGLPAEYATIDTTGLTANVNTSTLYAVPASGVGMYRVSAYVVETVAGSISSTLPNVQIVYNDRDTAGSITIDATPVLGVAGIGQTGALTTNTVGTAASGVIVISVTASTTIQYLTTNYASNLAGMTYALRLKLESL